MGRHPVHAPVAPHTALRASALLPCAVDVAQPSLRVEKEMLVSLKPQLGELHCDDICVEQASRLRAHHLHLPVRELFEDSVDPRTCNICYVSESSCIFCLVGKGPVDTWGECGEPPCPASDADDGDVGGLIGAGSLGGGGAGVGGDCKLGGR